MNFGELIYIVDYVFVCENIDFVYDCVCDFEFVVVV